MLVCHDLKKEVEQVSPPLPNGLRMIPILFYIALAGCAFFTAYFMIQKNASERDRAAQERVTAEEKKRISQIQLKHQALENDVKKANSMIEWVKGSDELQPLAMTINRSIDPNLSTINRLKLSRANDNPWQVQLDMKINTDDPGLLEQTLTELENARFKKFNPRRTQDEEGVNYSATLIKEE